MRVCLETADGEEQVQAKTQALGSMGTRTGSLDWCDRGGKAEAKAGSFISTTWRGDKDQTVRRILLRGAGMEIGGEGLVGEVRKARRVV